MKMVKGAKKNKADSNDTILIDGSQAKRCKYGKGKAKTIQGESIACQWSPRTKSNVNKTRNGKPEVSRNLFAGKTGDIKKGEDPIVPGTSGEPSAKTRGGSKSKITKQDFSSRMQTVTDSNEANVSAVSQDNGRVEVDSVSDFLENTNNSKVVEPPEIIRDGIEVFVENVDQSMDQSMFPSDNDGEDEGPPLKAESDDTTDSVKIKPLSDEEIQKRYDSDPYLRKYVCNLLSETLRKEGLSRDVDGVVAGNTGKHDKHGKIPVTPKRNVVPTKPNGNLVKSPSDTTLYKPAMRLSNGRESAVVSQISNFIAGIRMQQEHNDQGRGKEVNTVSANPVAMPGGSGADFSETQRRVQQSIVDAEKFRAQVNELPGNEKGLSVSIEQVPQLLEAHLTLARDNQNPCNDDEAQQLMLQNRPFQQFSPLQANVLQTVANTTPPGKSDEDFFQLMCHVEPGLRMKIENGEFVDLEKLLPKDKRSTYKPEEDRLEWVFRDGGTYLAPAGNRENRINGIRKWDQAFRVYAIIYCGAHPERAKEIWQYVEIIHTAAASFAWENVATYDCTFRQLMAFNPLRSWATTYSQMWNICMKDPLVNNKNNHQFRGGAGGGYFNGNGNNSSQQKPNTNKGGPRGKKSKYCWNFNKGVPCKFGNRCRFIEKCSYCDSPNHGLNTCPKVDKKDVGTPASEGQRV